MMVFWSLITHCTLWRFRENYFHSETWVLLLWCLASVKTRIVYFIRYIFSHWWSNGRKLFYKKSKNYISIIYNNGYLKILQQGIKALLLWNFTFDLGIGICFHDYCVNRGGERNLEEQQLLFEKVTHSHTPASPPAYLSRTALKQCANLGAYIIKSHQLNYINFNSSMKDKIAHNL